MGANQTFVNATSARRLMAAMQAWLDKLPKPGVLEVLDVDGDGLELRPERPESGKPARLWVEAEGGRLLSVDNVVEVRDALNAWLETQ